LAYLLETVWIIAEEQESPRKWQTIDVRHEITLSNWMRMNGIDQAWDSLYQVVDALRAQGMSLDESKDNKTGRKIYIP
jgi:hypothetical protein